MWPRGGLQTLSAIEQVARSGISNHRFRAAFGVRQVTLMDDNRTVGVKIRGNKTEIV